MSILNNPKFPRYLLQIGLAFVFLYAALSATLRPSDWVGYLPHFLNTLAPLDLLLKIFSLTEFVIAVWLLSGFKLFWAALFATLMFLGITFTNLAIFDVTFRDVGLLLASLALLTLSKERK